MTPMESAHRRHQREPPPFQSDALRKLSRLGCAAKNLERHGLGRRKGARLNRDAVYRARPLVALRGGFGLRLRRHQSNRLRLEGMLLGGEDLAAHFRKKAARGLLDALMEVRILLDELRAEVRIHSQQVI